MGLLPPLYALTLASASIMPSVPELSDWTAVIFVLLFTLTLFVGAAENLVERRIRFSRTGLWLIIFLTLVTVSIVTAIRSQTPVGLWFRGAVPFLFLLFYFPSHRLALKNPMYVISALYASCIVWMAYILTLTWNEISLVVSGSVLRVTHATDFWAYFQMPYGLIGLVITLFSPPRQIRLVRWVMAALFIGIPLLSVSRGQVLAIITVCVLYAARNLKSAPLMTSINFTLTICAIILFVLASGVQDNLTIRFSRVADELSGSRIMELRYAFGEFAKAPLLGHGLGHEIPLEITLSEHWDLIARSEKQSVSYMHNIIGYLIMNLGLVGLISYAGMIISPLKGCTPYAHRPTVIRTVRFSALCTVIALMWWFFIQAAFRLIQSNLILAATLALLSATKTASRHSHS